MRSVTLLVVGSLFAATLSDASLAQPRQHDNRDQHQQSQQQAGQYYYNGRWVDQNEWQRHSSERDRWAHNYQQRRPSRDNNNGTALVAGILGFALGAAIVGSQEQAQKARTADQSWDGYCAKKYRSYDRHSRTYLGVDGLRHYCQ